MPFQEHSPPGTVAKVDFWTSSPLFRLICSCLCCKSIFLKKAIEEGLFGFGSTQNPNNVSLLKSLTAKAAYSHSAACQTPWKTNMEPEKGDLNRFGRLFFFKGVWSRKQDLCRCTHFLIQTVETCRNLSDFLWVPCLSRQWRALAASGSASRGANLHAVIVCISWVVPIEPKVSMCLVF